jgi:ferritin-like metal-binding protein YciE
MSCTSDGAARHPPQRGPSARSPEVFRPGRTSRAAPTIGPRARPTAVASVGIREWERYGHADASQPLGSARGMLATSLAELRSAETQLIDALPRLAAVSGSRQLAQMLLQDYAATRRHRSRLDVVIRLVAVEIEVPDRNCDQMRDLIVEVGGARSDAGLVRAVQRVKQLEIASYDRARSRASELSFADAARALARTLDEERQTARRLADITPPSRFRS